MNPPFTFIKTFLASITLLCANSLSYAQTVVTLAAASDLKFALEEVASQYQKNTGKNIQLIFGSSGNFYSQLLQGAPFHIFMSADENFVFKLHSAGKTQDKGRLYAFGRIGIMVPKGSSLKADSQLKDLSAALQDGRLKKFAIASPEHAPYGMRAKEALQYSGLWPAIESKLVIGENISQAAQFATSGSTEGGIIAYSLALAPQVAKLGDFALIPQNWHQPLAQRMVLLKNAPPAATEFYHFIASPQAQTIMVKYGFVMPAQ